MNNQSVYSYIVSEENRFKTDKIPLDTQWEWNMHEFLRRCFLYKNSKFFTGNNDGNRPYNNIILPILHFAYRTTSFNVDDVVPYVDNEEDYHRSFFVKKFHPEWARQNGLDDEIDASTESYHDYGLALDKYVGGKKPISVDLLSLAFCDQTNIMSGAICEKHQMTPSELRSMKGKWDDQAIEDLIKMAKNEKEQSNDNTRKIQTTTKYIEVYELHGELPKSWLTGKEEDELEVERQMQIVAFYKQEDKENNGICLFKIKENKNIYKALVRDPIKGRACGRSAIEELFEAQTWTNYSQIKMKDMINQASIIAFQTADDKFKNKNVFDNLRQGQILNYEDGKPLSQVPINVGNITALSNSLVQWENAAMKIGSATSASLGDNPTSGTPFATVELLAKEGRGMHEYRLDKITRYWTNIYTEWIIPSMVQDLRKGNKFLEELSYEELQEIGEKILNKKVNKRIKEKMFAGKVTTPEEKEVIKQVLRAEFEKGGNKKFLEIIKDEFKTLPISVEISIKGKQKDLFGLTNKLVNVFRQVLAAPEILKIPEFAKMFNEIIEFSGLNPINYSSLTSGDSVTPPINNSQTNTASEIPQEQELVNN